MSKHPVTLGNFLKDSTGLHVVIELKDESAVEGTLSSCEVLHKLLRCRMHNCTLWILLFITVGIICDEQHSIAIEEAVESSFAGLTFGTNSYFSKFMRKRSASEPIRKNRCELKLVADYEFFRAIGNNNYANAARYLINMIERVNSIYTQIDWGIDVNGYRLVNLGFSIKEIKIYDRPSTSPRHFNALASTQDSFSPMELLKSFSAEEGTNSTCLTFLVSAKVFDHGILGLANIGQAGERGICATKPIENVFSNTAIMSVRRKSELMITRVVDLVAAHELGHAWGTLHDDPNDSECNPPNSQDGQNGRYMMHESVNSGYDKNNYFFSPCSIRSIHKALYEIADKCFVEEQAALCGNGILEDGEECDFGGQLAAEKTSDRCCTNKCTLKHNAVCSPRHSECCAENCNFSPSHTLCQPTSPDTCKKSSYCTGNSSKCPEPKPIKDGIECADEGKCLTGECVSMCQILSKDLSPCICENLEESCQRCCRSAKTSLCQPVKPVRYLPEGSICIQGQCHSNVCEKKLTDEASLLSKFFNSFKDTPHHKVFADYFVFIIVFTSLLVWCPCAAYIVYRDQKQHLEVVTTSEEDIEIVEKIFPRRL
ncbi:metallo-peptidase family m12 domain-containing protein [Ditylenchus destructor]|uniref:Metallo-peptidase family m12 domain-containing protein n=1 Tax=Ditylenchus destructor TaxID=166010 RepID=A0AAD4N499_9BILA|nr:metallo-peptidase family m12 domain-containing protein [Ditylenchus destructor]